MPTNVIMPALGMDQDKGTLVRWIKQEGDSVAKGEPIMEVETDKVLVEIEATASGVLANVSAAEGDEIPVGQVIAEIVEEGTTPAHPAVSKELRPDSAAATPSTASVQDVGATRVARQTDPPQSSRTLASPKARRLASEQGVDPAAIRGSGPEGAVLAGDLVPADRAETATPSAARTPGPRPLAPAPSTPSPQPPTPTTRAWQVMADRMTQAWKTTPHFALMREVDASALRDMRARIAPAVSQHSDASVTYTDLLVKLVAAAIHRQPRINASWRDGSIEQHTDINIGLAVATDDGLIVPVIQRADTLSVGELAVRRRDLVERAATGKLAPGDVAGGTFTLSNLGMYSVDAFAAIVNPPQAAILAVGRIADRVVAVDGQPAVRPTIVLTLSCDHRAIDGARAAQFLDELVGLIEEPWGLLA